MKGLSIKRIAALGLGAALVGSVLAPAVMAATYYNNLSELKKDNIIDSTGMPVVDIVVGSLGQAPDVVWAGNIAAKVAELAVSPVAGSSGAKTVDITVGGTSTTSGAGQTAQAYADFTNAEAQLKSITVTNTQMPTLISNTSAKLKWNSTSYTTTTVSEDLNAAVDVDFQSEKSSSKYGVGELYASIDKDKIFYNVNIAGGLDISADRTGLDSNSYFDVKIPFLGKIYTLDEIDASESRIVMYADTTPTDLTVGQSVTVTPASGYAGKTMTVELVDLIQVGSGNTEYQPKWALMIDGAAVKYVQKAATSTYNLKDEFGSSYFGDNIYVTSAGLNLSANKYTATIRTGTERIELRDGYGYPYTGDSTVDSKQPWEVKFQGGTLITKISLTNQWKYDRTNTTESDTAKNVLLVGDAVTLPNDFAKVSFAGFQTKPTTEVSVGDVAGIDGGGIEYRDIQGTDVKVPFFVPISLLDLNKPRLATIQGRPYTFWIEAKADSNYKLLYIEGDKTSATDHTSLTWTDTNLFSYNSATDVMGTEQAVSLDLGARDSTGAVVYTDYLLIADASDESAALVLDDQNFSLFNKAKSASYPKLQFVDTNTANASAAYYYPNTDDFVTTLMNGTYSATKYMAAQIRYIDNNASEGRYVNMYVRTGDTGSVWDYESLKNETNATIGGPSMDANYFAWTDAIRDGSDYFKEALTQDGTDIVSDNAKFTLTIPEEQRLVEVYEGGTGTSTTTTGGTPYTGVAVGQTKGNVTVNAISGATSGVTVNKVGNIVRLDTESGFGKSIIVGGFLVNNAAKALDVNGQTLQDRLITDGDYVAAVLTNGSIVVAGWNATDTGTAAQKLIAAMDTM